MSELSVLQYLPLVSTGVWWGLSLYQVYRDRFRTWTEVFFLAACVSVGGYGLADYWFFTVGTVDWAYRAALISFTMLLFGIVFIFLFGVVFFTRMDRRYFLALVPVLVFLPFFWMNLIPAGGIVPLTESVGGPPWKGNWDFTWFAAFFAIALAYAFGAGYTLFRTYREVAHQTTKLRGRMLGLFVTVLLSVIFGVSSNGIRGFTGWPIPSLFSSALALPGVVSWVALSPLSKERFSVAVRRWKARGYDIKMAFLIYQDGTLIGAEVAPGEKVIDQDLFSATLDVIQNFMRTSFPGLRGKFLQSIRHGDYLLVIERGRFVYLVVVMVGAESDQLRRQMRDAILRFEADNRALLADWRGVPSEATGTSTLLLALLEG